MRFIYDIPNNGSLKRLGDSLYIEGYIFNPTLGTTDVVQKRQFLISLTKDFYRSIVFNAERSQAIANDPVDSAALQAQRFLGLDDITVTETN